MPKDEKIKIARALASQLHLTEEAIDTALTEAALLIENCVQSRRAVRIGTMSGTNVHENTLKAMMALSDAQKHMSLAHSELNQIKSNMGLSAIAPIFDKPESKAKLEKAPIANPHQA